MARTVGTASEQMEGSMGGKDDEETPRVGLLGELA